MKISISILLASILCFGCNDISKNDQPVRKVKKVVANKKEGTETEYHYRYNAYRGKMYEQPDVHSVYYLIYSDGTYDKVDIGRYSIIDIGDTVSDVLNPHANQNTMKTLEEITLEYMNENGLWVHISIPVSGWRVIAERYAAYAFELGCNRTKDKCAEEAKIVYKRALRNREIIIKQIVDKSSILNCESPVNPFLI